MKAKIVRGRGFRGAVDYALDEGPRASGRKHAELIGGSLAGRNSDEITAEFAAARRLRPDIERPVWHTSLSCPAGERLSADQWEAVAADFLARMGFDPATTPWIAARHSDTQHDHLHIIASRVGVDGRVWAGQWEARHAIEATQQIEIAHGLQRTKGLEQRADRKRPRDGERRRAERTGEVPARTRLQRAIDEAIESGARDVPALVEALAQRGVTARPNVATTGKVSGFSFALDAEGVAFRGSDLGKRYSWAGLQRAGIVERLEVAEPVEPVVVVEPVAVVQAEPVRPRREAGALAGRIRAPGADPYDRPEPEARRPAAGVPVPRLLAQARADAAAVPPWVREAVQHVAAALGVVVAVARAAGEPVRRIRREAGALAGRIRALGADPYDRPEASRPAPEPRRAPEASDRQAGAPEARRPAPEAQADPLDYWREAVAEAERSGDADAVVLARDDLEAAQRVAARGAPTERWIVQHEVWVMLDERAAAEAAAEAAEDDDDGIRRR